MTQRVGFRAACRNRSASDHINFSVASYCSALCQAMELGVEISSAVRAALHDWRALYRNVRGPGIHACMHAAYEDILYDHITVHVHGDSLADKNA